MKVGFDEEVNTEDVETLRKLMNKVWNPTSVIDTFAFTGHILSRPSQLLAKHKEKNASLRYVFICLFVYLFSYLVIFFPKFVGADRKVVVFQIADQQVE